MTLRELISGHRERLAADITSYAKVVDEICGGHDSVRDLLMRKKRQVMEILGCNMYLAKEKKEGVSQVEKEKRVNNLPRKCRLYPHNIVAADFISHCQDLKSLRRSQKRRMRVIRRTKTMMNRTKNDNF